jgi:RHS repeat-associated protein
LEIDQSGTTYWYQADTLGSVRLLTDSAGATPATYAYSAFGSTRTSGGSITNEVRFSGERTDTESGLEFLRARTYDPYSGTFLQRDSWGMTPTDSQSIDAYAYTENNPANATDPSGHCIQCAITSMDARSGSGASSGTTITKAGSGAPAVTGKTPGPPSPSAQKQNSTPKVCSWLPWESDNCEGQGAGGLGNLWAQGPGGFINDHATQIAVVAIIAGSLFVCNVGSEACAALILAAVNAGGTVCAEDDEVCVQAAEGGGGGGSVVTEAQQVVGGSQNSLITFGHGARHLVGTALEGSDTQVESAIQAQVRSATANVAGSGSFWGRVTVNGTTVEYRAYTQADGSVNIGTYYVP